MNKIYATVLEDTALKQFASALAQPFTIRGALMPDAHTGYSLPIGAVVATKDYVLPAWVGYDIGCGMCAVQLAGVAKEDIDKVSKEIFTEIYKKIPVGFNINKTKLNYSDSGLSKVGKEIAAKKNYQSALGSLGGGNHFIEIGYDEENTAWIVIHSGSRGVGHGIATHYMKAAHPEGKAKDGHFGFHTSSEEGKHYIQDLRWCLDYALANRKEMIDRVVAILHKTLDVEFNTVNFINRNHNHAEFDCEEDAWIHRKGATHAAKGMMGVIPGNMRDGSFIIRGKGNPDSLYSSSHGAGRVLGRRKAKQTLDVGEFEQSMEGIVAKVGDSTLDESPFAYKNIYDVMKLQEDLVEVVTHITPLINIKG